MSHTVPPIGVPRCYAGPGVPVLYPGETARSLGLETRDGYLQIKGWLVEPSPGWTGLVRRTHWRVWGRWFGIGPCRRVVTVGREPRGAGATTCATR